MAPHLWLSRPYLWPWVQTSICMALGREVWRSKSSEAHVIHLKAPPTLQIVVGGETLEREFVPKKRRAIKRALAG